MACVPPGVQYDVVSNGVDSLFQTFREETNGIPDHPRDWTFQDVCQWRRWAEDKFNLGIQDSSFLDQYDGKALCRLTKHNLCFNTSIAIGEILWESLQRIFHDYNKKQEVMMEKYLVQSLPSISYRALPKESAAAVVPTINTSSSPLHDMAGDADNLFATLTSETSPVQFEFSDHGSMSRSPASVSGLSDLDNSPVHSPQPQVPSPDSSPVKSSSGRSPPGRKRGPKPIERYSGKGPIQLWQFILELLLDEEQTVVEWTGEDRYEFKLRGKEVVAKLWGECKNKPKMNYEKLSRGLRYYYGKNIISKVHGKQYVYRFLCDIERILGYDPTLCIGQKEDKPVIKEEKEASVQSSACSEPISEPEPNIPPSPLDSVISQSSCIYSTDSFFGDNLETIGLKDFIFDGMVPDPIAVPDDAFDSYNML